MSGNGICRAGLVMQDCAQYTKVDKEMEAVMSQVLVKERLSGNGCGFLSQQWQLTRFDSR